MEPEVRMKLASSVSQEEAKGLTPSPALEDSEVGHCPSCCGKCMERNQGSLDLGEGRGVKVKLACMVRMQKKSYPCDASRKLPELETLEHFNFQVLQTVSYRKYKKKLDQFLTHFSK